MIKYIRELTISIIFLGAFSTFAGITYSSGSSGITFGSFFYYLFVVLPYLILWWVTSKLHLNKTSLAKKIALFITAVLVSILSILVTLSYVYGPTSSTSALVFIFVPIYSTLIICVAFPVAEWILNLIIEKE